MEKKKDSAVKTGGGTSGATSVTQEKKTAKSVGEALLKAALGCRVAEVTEEYAEVDGELRLLKRKKTKKDIPPDLKAVQLLLETREDKDISLLSDEELEAEKQRLLRLLYERETGGKSGAEKTGLAKSGAGKTTKKKRRTAKKSAAGRGAGGKAKAGAAGNRQARETGEKTAERAE
ncbi:MAG: hypothetical protein ACI4SH_07505 [Candidatus Scatosoma sp.]